MSRSMRFLTILACALPLACSDTSTAPTATAPPPVPRLSANPASNGSIVFRDEWGWWVWWWTDSENQLTAIHANFEIVPASCGANPLWTPPTVQSVVSGKYPVGEEQELVHFLIRAPEAFIYVFSSTTTDWCQPIASGVGRMVVTDSDLFADDQADRPQMEAYGTMAEGQLTGPDGRPYHYSGHLRGLYHDGVRDVNVHINLQPLGQ